MPQNPIKQSLKFENEIRIFARKQKLTCSTPDRPSSKELTTKEGQSGTGKGFGWGLGECLIDTIYVAVNLSKCLINESSSLVVW